MNERGLTRRDALKLARLLRGRLCHVNLIPLNPTEDLQLVAPSAERALAFEQRLRAAGIAATIRVNRGRDILAGFRDVKKIAVDHFEETGIQLHGLRDHFAVGQQVRAGEHRVHRQMRPRGMSSAALDVNRHEIGSPGNREALPLAEPATKWSSKAAPMSWTRRSE